MRTLRFVAISLFGCSGCILASNAFAGNATVNTDGGLKVYDEGEYWFKLNGRMQFDEVYFDGDSTSRVGYPSGANIRRAEVALKGGFSNDFSYKLHTDFSRGSASLKEAFVSYTGLNNSTFAVGNISAPFGLEAWGSSSASTFMEPSLITNVFAPSHGLGLYGDYIGDVYTVAGALYHPGMNQTSGGAATSSDVNGASLRITFAPIHEQTYVWHFGASTRYQSSRSGTPSLIFSSSPGAIARTTPNSVDTGLISGVKHYTVTGFETAYLEGPWSFQGEWQQAHASREGLPGVKYGGYYTTISYVVTGESRIYDFASGTFDNPVPRRPMGAFEIAGSWGFVNLNDVFVLGGSEHNAIFGANWYVNKNLKLSANYILAKVAPRAQTPVTGRELDIYAFRAQVIW